ncbi:cysteine-rich receptor-like protein kinase 19 [Phragmites australis]|uniref:cysteine-rich receptor-like protein kinase 19 n=1 Tax=Phragmites australis TaxID=29695 RepID=UPI002D781603|nr:cysteine-rich receptor-like protein kinase 19 [Phragmites australis]
MLLPPVVHLLLAVVVVSSAAMLPATAEDTILSHKCSVPAGNTSSDAAAYRSNLNALATMLVAGAKENGSAVGAVGAAPDAAYGVALCRGDFTGDVCALGLSDALYSAINNSEKAFGCGPQFRDVTLYYDRYQLRLSSVDFLSGDGNVTKWAGNNTNVVTPAAAAQRFDELVKELVKNIADIAADKPDRYATGRSWFKEKGLKVYGLVQCTVDMPPERCRACLDRRISEFPQTFLRGQYGGRILVPRCTVRYETDDTFFNTTNLSVDLHKPKPSKAWIWATIAVVFVFLLVACLLLHRWIKIRRKRELARSELRRLSIAVKSVINLWRMEEGNSGFSLYDFSQMKIATNGFSTENKLGQGGFGAVYKGRLPDGLEIAVKRLGPCSLQGLLEFKNEIQLIAKLQHRNLVKLLGCCIEGEHEKILVYEYMPNKSLDLIIFDNKKGVSLDWPKRMNIIEGISQGLLYLHIHSRLCVVHRDLKASNILLDSEMNPKISDFGMARIFSSSVAESNTTRIVGTHGYIAPEYASDGVCSVKSDVFSFGVLVLEIVSGKMTAGSYRYDGKLYKLIAYAWLLWRAGQWHELVDRCVRNEKHHFTMARCVHVALLCVQESADDRPAMDEVLRMLGSSEGAVLPEPKQPAYFNVRPVGTEMSASCDMSISITLSR